MLSIRERIRDQGLPLGQIMRIDKAEGGRLQIRALEGSHRDWSKIREQSDRARERKC